MIIAVVISLSAALLVNAQFDHHGFRLNRQLDLGLQDIEKSAPTDQPKPEDLARIPPLSNTYLPAKFEPSPSQQTFESANVNGKQKELCKSGLDSALCKDDVEKPSQDLMPPYNGLEGGEQSKTKGGAEVKGQNEESTVASVTEQEMDVTTVKAAEPVQTTVAAESSSVAASVATTTPSSTEMTTTETVVVDKGEASNDQKNNREYLPPVQEIAAAAQTNIAFLQPLNEPSSNDHHHDHHHHDNFNVCTDAFHSFLCAPLKTRRRITGALPDKFRGSNSFLQFQRVFPGFENFAASSNTVQNEYLPPRTDTFGANQVQTTYAPFTTKEPVYTTSTTTARPYSQYNGYTTTTTRPYSQYNGYTTTTARQYSQYNGYTTTTARPYSQYNGYTTTTARPYSQYNGYTTTTARPYSQYNGYTTSTARPYSQYNGYTTSRPFSQFNNNNNNNNNNNFAYTTSRPSYSQFSQTSYNYDKPYVPFSGSSASNQVFGSRIPTTASTSTIKTADNTFVQGSSFVNPQPTYKPASPVNPSFPGRNTYNTPFSGNENRQYLPPEQKFPSASFPSSGQNYYQQPSTSSRPQTSTFGSTDNNGPSKYSFVSQKPAPTYQPSGSFNTVTSAPSSQTFNSFSSATSSVRPTYSSPLATSSKPFSQGGYTATQPKYQSNGNYYSTTVKPFTTTQTSFTQDKFYLPPDPKVPAAAQLSAFAVAAPQNSFSNFNKDPCNDPFHSFLCTGPKQRKRITGARPSFFNGERLFASSNQNEDVVRPDKALEGASAQNGGYQYPTPSKPLPVPSKPLPAPSKPLPVPSKPLPAPSKPLPAPSKPLPTPSKPLPVPSKPLPVPSKPLPAPSKPLPVPSKPLPTQSPTLPPFSTSTGYAYPRPEKGFPLPSQPKETELTTKEPDVTTSEPQPDKSAEQNVRVSTTIAPTTGYQYQRPQKTEQVRPRPVETSTYRQPTYQQPTYQPSYQQPTEPKEVRPRPVETSTYRQPTYQQPTYQPSYQQPTEPKEVRPRPVETSTYRQPTYQQPTYQPSYQQPTEQKDVRPRPVETSTYRQPTYQQPTYQQPSYQQPTEQKEPRPRPVETSTYRQPTPSVPSKGKGYTYTKPEQGFKVPEKKGYSYAKPEKRLELPSEGRRKSLPSQANANLDPVRNLGSAEFIPVNKIDFKRSRPTNGLAAGLRRFGERLRGQEKKL